MSIHTRAHPQFIPKPLLNQQCVHDRASTLRKMMNNANNAGAYMGQLMDGTRESEMHYMERLKCNRGVSSAVRAYAAERLATLKGG